MSDEKKIKKTEQDNSSKVLLHTCCAPCSIHCVDSLRAEGIEPVSYWFNPNIHPYTEYRSRKTTLEAYAKEIHLPLIIDNTYGLREFCKNVIHDLSGRCFYCYDVRLEQTAQYAAEHGFASFTYHIKAPVNSLPHQRVGSFHPCADTADDGDGPFC